MLFSSFSFVAFFSVVFVFYWSLAKHIQIQNIFLLVCSYVFYGMVNWRMLPILVIATVIFYLLGKKIDKCYEKDEESKAGNAFTNLGVILGLCILLYFKYFNFFLESFSYAFSLIGLHTNIHTFSIIMPLGVSYFTFKLISYVLDISRGKMSACHDFVVFANFVAFFPTITAGPIDRPKTFMSQLHHERTFDLFNASEGLRQILWGAFKKIVIADNIATVLDNVWSDLSGHNSYTLFIAMMLYAVQMYMDFSGYSDMAIGVGKLLGIKIAKNFNYPFFATNIAEFWRRWHMSLTGWLTDYVFSPLCVKFRNLGQTGIMLAIIINMVLVGIWHGDNWTYAVFGLYNGLLFIPIIWSGKMSKKQKLQVSTFGTPRFTDALRMFGVFLLYAFAMIFFRSESVGQSFRYIGLMITSFYGMPHFLMPKYIYLLIVGVFVLEWYQRDNEFAMSANKGVFRSAYIRYPIYVILFILICVLAGPEQIFLYAQF